MASVTRTRLGAGGDGSNGWPTCSSKATLRRTWWGCSEEQVALPFDYRVLLTAPAEVLVQRLMARTTNGYGRSAGQRAQVLADVEDVEPLLRRSADLLLVTTEPTPLIADVLLDHVLETLPEPPHRQANAAVTIGG